MANKQGRAIPLSDFNPRGATIEGLQPVKYPAGEAAEDTARAAASVADSFGKLADEAAVVEGGRAGREAGADPAFRPTGGSSLRARAYDKAAIDTYTDNLDASMRQRMQDAFEQNKDNPAGLNTALQGLHARMTANDLFPEIAGSFNKKFTELSVAYRNKAASAFEANQQDQTRASLLDNLSSVDTTTRKAIATLDPDDPAAERVVADGVKRVTSLYQRAADSDAITQTTAAAKIIGAKNDAWGQLILTRASKLSSAEAMDSFVKKFDDDFAAGKYDGKLDGAGYSAVKAALEQQGRQRSTAARANFRTLEGAVNDMVERAASGAPVPESEWTSVAVLARDTPGGDQVMALANAKRGLVAQLNASSIQQGDAILQTMRDELRKGGGEDPAKWQLVQYGEKYLQKERQQINQDQLGLAQKKGIVAAVAPVDFEAFATKPDAAGADALAGQIRARVAQADSIGETWSRNAQYWRPEEKARLTEIFNKGGAPALGVAKAIVAGAGERAPAMLHQLGGEAPKLAQVGAMLADGGSLAAASDAVAAIEQRNIKGGKLPVIPHEIDTPIVTSTLGQAYLWSAGTTARVADTAREIASVRLQRENIDPRANASRAKEIYERALKEATGAVFDGDQQIGGIAGYKPPGWWYGSARVVVPPGIKADRFGDVVKSITDDDLKALPQPPVTPDGKAYTAADLKSAVPVLAPGGYAFARSGYSAGDRIEFVLGRNGKPFVLDWNAIEPTLRRRRPDLFAGG